jgi:methyl-accepting chemotaxis protein
MKAIRKGDYDVARVNLQPTFNRLTSQGLIDRLLVVGKDKNVIFSSPLDFPDNFKHPLFTLDKVLSESKQVYSTEVDTDGKVMFALAFPIFHRGKIIGAAVYLKKLDTLINTLGEFTQSDVIITSNDGKQTMYNSNPQIWGNKVFTFEKNNGFKKNEVGDKLYAEVYTPIKNFSGEDIAKVLFLQENTENFRNEQKFVYVSFAIIAIIIPCIGLFYFLFLRRNLKPILLLADNMMEISSGNLNVEIYSHPVDDEIGSMAKTLHVFKEKGLEAEEMRKEQQLEQAGKQERAKKIENLIKNFEKTAAHSITTATDSANILNQAANFMGGSVEDVNTKSDNALKAAEETSANVNTVAAAAEQMAASVKEISSQFHKSTKVVNQSVEKAELASCSAKSLEKASTSIGDIVGLIKDIAEQINLLALNATSSLQEQEKQVKGLLLSHLKLKT